MCQVCVFLSDFYKYSSYTHTHTHTGALCVTASVHVRLRLWPFLLPGSGREFLSVHSNEGKYREQLHGAVGA